MEVRGVKHEPTQRRCPIKSGRALRGVPRIHSDLRRMVQERRPPIGTVRYIREGRALMARRATGFIPEQIPAASGGHSIEAAFRRIRGPQAQLIVEQGWKLWRDEIRALRDENADPRIGEVSVAAHLSDANIGVPI